MDDFIIEIASHGSENPIHLKVLENKFNKTSERAIRRKIVSAIYDGVPIGSIPNKGGYFVCNNIKDLMTAKNDLISRLLEIKGRLKALSIAYSRWNYDGGKYDLEPNKKRIDKPVSFSNTETDYLWPD